MTTFYEDPEIRAKMEDMRYLHGGHEAMVAAAKLDEDVSWLKAPAWLKTNWMREEVEINNLNMPVKKVKGRIEVDGKELEFLEGLVYRVKGKIPARFYRKRHAAIRRKWRKSNRLLIDEIKRDPSKMPFKLIDDKQFVYSENNS